MSDSLKERLKKRRKEITDRQSGSGIFYIKEGTTRLRVLPVGEDVDWALEVSSFYLGGKLKGVFSRTNIGEECPIQKYYEKLLASKKEEDKDKAKALTPKVKYLVPCVIYNDDRTVNEERSPRLVQLTTGTYGEMVDAFLDPDWGDFTDPEDGYDFKVKRTGTGKTDTEYTLTPQKNTSLPKKWHKPVDLQEMLAKVIPTYEEAEEKLAQWIIGEDDSEPTSKKKRKSRDDDEDEDEEKPLSLKERKAAQRKKRGDA